MKLHGLRIIVLILLPLFTAAQQFSADSLKNLFVKATADSERYMIARSLYDFYEESNRDSALRYADQCMVLARKNKKVLAEVHSMTNKGYQLTLLGKYAEALQILLKALEIVNNTKTTSKITWTLFSFPFTGDNRLLMACYVHHIFGILMWQTDNPNQEIAEFTTARNLASSIGHKIRQLMADMNLGRTYMMAGRLDSAIIFEKEAIQLAFETGFKKFLGQMYVVMGAASFQKGDIEKAKEYYHLGIKEAAEQNNLNSVGNNYFNLAKLFLAQSNADSALYYGKSCLAILPQLGAIAGIIMNYGTVYENIYRDYQLKNQHDSAFKYQGLALIAKDSLYRIRIANLTSYQNASVQEELRLQNIEKEKTAYQNKIRLYILSAGIFVLLLLALIFYRNDRQKTKARIEIEKAYENLKATQTKLIQSEKMASLGELTAGIAHEIQNPLNFVNNFSEVNKELLAEMREEIDKGNINEVKSIATDVIDNEEKINHHGKRADAIVKGMLQHSRSSTGQMELTDLNALVDEYVRLAYHGLRAKDKTFNAKFETKLDPALSKIKVVPQDMGRVILNLVSNAFYAVNEKKKSSPADYEPTVTVSTKKVNNKIEVRVADNGNGIPQGIVEKIFQPFFTTKPTGQGTGLGLSLTYDIITKGHAGEIKVETKEGEGSEFKVILSS